LMNFDSWIFPYQTFDNDSFHQCAKSLLCLCVSLDHRSVPFGHL
jgi:hypothetical protein